MFRECGRKGGAGFQQTLAPALAIWRITDHDKKSPECDPFRRQSLKKSKHDKAWIQSGGIAKIVSAGTNDQNKAKHPAEL
jgi:hypothetical protein